MTMKEPDAQSIYVHRADTGEIVSVSLQQDTQHRETIPRDAEEVQEFVQQITSTSVLARTDLEMARVLEDLIAILIQKDVLCITDLPEAAQAKLLQRRRMRRPLSGNMLIDDEHLI